MNSHPKEICIKGFIKAERHASPHIIKIISEILQNSLEANRIARNNGAKQTKIIVTLFFNAAGLFTNLSVEDFASHDSGINNINTKQIFSLYNHFGENDGFSEFGIGGKQSCMQLGNRIEYKTKSNTSGGTLTWDIAKIINGEVDNYFDSIQYNQEPLSIPSPYTTGTKVYISEIEKKFCTSSISDYLLYTNNANSNFKDDMCRSFVKIKNETVTFKFIKDGKHYDDFDLKPFSNLCKDENKKYYKKYNLKVYNIDDTITTLVEEKGKLYQLYKSNEFKTDKLMTKDEIFTTKTEYKHSTDNRHLIGTAKLKLSTYINNVEESEDTNNLHSQMGYDTHRQVKDGSVVRTNITPLLLKWKKFPSHRTRYTRFRGAILYDKHLDSIVQTDKCKTVSDDRDFDPTFRRTILQLSEMYFNQMKRKYDLYNTDKKKDTEKNTQKEDTSEEASEEDSSEEDTQNNTPEEDTQQDDIQDEDTLKDDTQEEDTQAKNTQAEDTQEDYTQEEDTQVENTQEEDTQEEDTQEEDTQEEDTQEEDTQEEDTQAENTQAENTQQEDTQEEDTLEEDTSEEDTPEENIPEEDTQEEDTPEKDTAENDYVPEDNVHVDNTKETMHKELIISTNLTSENEHKTECIDEDTPNVESTDDNVYNTIIQQEDDNIRNYNIPTLTQDIVSHVINDIPNLGNIDSTKDEEIKSLSQEIICLLNDLCSHKSIDYDYVLTKLLVFRDDITQGMT